MAQFRFWPVWVLRILLRMRDRKEVLCAGVRREVFQRRFGGAVQFANSSSEPEGASLARCALHPDFSTHQFNQTGRNGQAESGASVLARGGTVGLTKGFENDFLFVQRDAGPGVPNDKFCADGGFVFRLNASRDGDRTTICKLDGVAD